MRGMRLALRRTWGRRWWPIVDGIVVDKRRLEKRRVRGGEYRYYLTIVIDEYLVEVPNSAGDAVRVRIAELDTDVPKVLQNGVDGRNKKVRVHLNGNATKAVFAADPREPAAQRKRRDRLRRERSDERFRRQEEP